MRDLNRRLSRREFLYRKCRLCGLIFIDAIPVDLADYYRDGYYEIPPTLELLRRTAEPERYRIDIVRRFVRTGRLLEIGAAYGLFAILAKDAGFDVDAIEMDARCCRYLRETVRVNAVQSDSPQFAVQQLGTYDVIALWHVIEHLPDPWTCLRNVAARLRPEGALVLATPNPASFQFRLLGRRWPHVDAPRHLHLIPIENLARLLGDLGLELAWVTTEDPGGINWNAFGWTQSVVNMAHPRMPQRPLRGIGKLASIAFRFIERRPLHGSAYTAVFRRKQNA